MKTLWIATAVMLLALLVGLKTRRNGDKPSTPAHVMAADGPTPPRSVEAASAASRLQAAATDSVLLPKRPRIAGPGIAANPLPSVGGPLNQLMFRQLEGIMAVSDVIHDNPGLADEALIQVAMERTGLPKETLAGILAEYPTSSASSLAEHYRRAVANPELEAVAAAFDRAGVARAVDSTLLADGFRLCSLRTLYDEFLSRMWEDLRAVPEGADPGQGVLDEAARIADERSDALVAIEAVFKERFIHRHGIEPATVQALLGALWPLKVTTATAEELHPPRLVQR